MSMIHYFFDILLRHIEVNVDAIDIYIDEFSAASTPASIRFLWLRDGLGKLYVDQSRRLVMDRYHTR
jgi:hypothetical protein